MKKIIIILLIILTSLSFSNNLDKYESKRVFDKSMDAFLTVNFKKYENDPEMKRTLVDTKVLDVGAWSRYLPFIKENKYEVLDVKEVKNESILTVRATFDSVADMSMDEKVEIYKMELHKMNQRIIDEGFDRLSQEFTDVELDKFEEELLLNVSKKLMENSKKETKVIKVYMDKINGMWSLFGVDENFKNIDFYTTLMPTYGVYDELENEEF